MEKRTSQRRKTRRYFSGNLSKTLFRQTVLCLLIVLLAILIKKLDLAMANRALDTVQTFMSQDYSGKALQTLTSLPTSIETSVSEGQARTRYVAPCNEDALSMTFEESAQDSSGKLHYYPAQGELQVYATSGGTVLSVEGEEENKVIRIDHGGNLQSQYEGCCSIYVEPLQKVRKGELIATVAQGEESCLTFSMWKGEASVNPADFIRF